MPRQGHEKTCNGTDRQKLCFWQAGDDWDDLEWESKVELNYIRQTHVQVRTHTHTQTQRNAQVHKFPVYMMKHVICEFATGRLQAR